MLTIANSDVAEAILDLPDVLVIPEGDQQATLTATGVSADNDPVELTLSLDEVDLTTAIRVVPSARDPQVSDFDAAAREQQVLRFHIAMLDARPPPIAH